MMPYFCSIQKLILSMPGGEKIMDAMISKTFNYLAETAGIPTEELISRMTKLIHKITIEEHSYFK